MNRDGTLHKFFHAFTACGHGVLPDEDEEERAHGPYLGKGVVVKKTLDPKYTWVCCDCGEVVRSSWRINIITERH